MIRNISEPIDVIAQRYNIRFFVYFGSYGTEYYKEDSDIDIAFLADRALTTAEKMSLLEEMIKYHRKSEIDLADLYTAEPLLRYEVARTGRVVYESQQGIFERYSIDCRNCYRYKQYDIE